MKKSLICGIASLALAAAPALSTFATGLGSQTQDIMAGEVDETIYSVDISWGDMTFDWKYDYSANTFGFATKIVCSEIGIGAGTVLDAVTARLDILAGAEYIVSPSFDQETAEMCNLYQIPYLPGCMTITEIKTALKSGVDIVKLFPGSAYGPSIISAFKAPMPHVNIMPTGGVSLDNMKEWFDAGVVTVGVGGNLLAPAATGDFDKVTEVAQQYAAKMKEIKR